MEIGELAPNFLLFEFGSKDSRDRVYEHQPWNVKGYILILKDWPSRLNWQEVDLMTFIAWVQIHGLPLDRSNEQIAGMIRSSIVKVLELEGKNEKKIWCVRFIRVRVMLNSRKPLPIGYTLTRSE